MKKIVFLFALLMLTSIVGLSGGSAQPVAPAGSLLDALPDGTGAIVIDFQKVAGSSLWSTLIAQEKIKVAVDKVQSEMTDLGLKLSDIHTIAVGFPAAGVSNPTVALAGNFDQNQLLARMRTNAKLKLTSEKYKDFALYRVREVPVVTPSKRTPATKGAGVREAPDDTSGTWFVFYDSGTVVAGDLTSVRGSVDVKSGGRPSIAQNAKLADALSQDSTAAVRFAMTITPAFTGALPTKDLPLPEFSSISLVFGTIDFSSGVDLNATLRSDNAEHAKSIADKLNALLSMGKGILGSMSDPKFVAISEALKTVNVTSAEADVKITGNVPMDLLNNLLSSKKGQ